MRCLYIDSCSERLMILAINGDKVAGRESDGKGLRHNSILLPYVEEALCEVGMNIGEVEYIAACVGPGSFTGIRLGVTTANGLALSTGAKRIAMNAFENIAYNSSDSVLALIDARHGNYYGGEYRDGRCIALGNYTASDIDLFNGKTIIWDGRHNTDNIIAAIRDKISAEDFTDLLAPMYLKLSQAEREANENRQTK